MVSANVAWHLIHRFQGVQGGGGAKGCTPLARARFSSPPPKPLPRLGPPDNPHAFLANVKRWLMHTSPNASKFAIAWALPSFPQCCNDDGWAMTSGFGITSMILTSCQTHSVQWVGWGGLRPRVWRDINIQISKIITASHWSFWRFVLPTSSAMHAGMWGWQKITVLQACSPNFSYHSASMRIHAQCINLHFLQVPLRHHLTLQCHQPRLCVMSTSPYMSVHPAFANPPLPI